MKMMSSVMKLTLSGLCIFAFITSCVSWPISNNYRKSYTYNDDIDDNYAIPLMAGSGMINSGNQWEIAQDPYEYEPPEQSMDDYSDSDHQQQEINVAAQIEALSKLFDSYDTNEEEPIWGQVIRERPETELEELKQLSGRRDIIEKRGLLPSTTTTMSPTQQKLKSVTEMSPIVSKLVPKSKTDMSPPHYGQKEVPLLRPPIAPKTIENTNPVVTQRSSSSDKKLSPYDKLRKYLSIEDALKKESEKRSVAASQLNSRQVKRSFVADSESLTGQLNKLKKTDS